MQESPGWDIDVESCTPRALFELYQQLKDSEKHAEQRLKCQRQLIACLRRDGRSTQEIVDVAIHGVGSKAERRVIGKAWSEALGITEQEFNRLANAERKRRAD